MIYLQRFPISSSSPDCIISFELSGDGILEVKFPWTSREKLIRKYVSQPTSCLACDDNN